MNRKTTTHCAIAVLGSATGALALFYLVFPWSLTLKNFGLSVEDQLVAQRILTPLLFVALGALAASCEYFRCVRLQTGTKSGVLVRVLRVVALVVLPVVIVLCTLNTPFWSYPSPETWDRPRFIYGWFLPCKVERTPLGFWLLFLNIFLWTLYLMVLLGYRRIKHYLIMLVVMLVLSVPFAMFVGIKPVYRGLDRNSVHGQRVSTTPSNQSSTPSGFAKVPVCLKPRPPAAKTVYDSRSLDKMVVNSTTCTKRAKSFSRVEHVEQEVL